MKEVAGNNPGILKSGKTTGAEYENMWKAISSGQERRGEFHNKKKNGELFWELALILPIYNLQGEIINFIAIKEDITESKIAKEELLEKNIQLRLLTDHMEKIREEERFNLARELHDELGQQLTVMKMDISWLHEKLGKTDEHVRYRTEELRNIIDQTVTTIRRISSELRPSILDDMGLAAAIDWRLSEFKKRSGINTEFDEMKCELLLSDSEKTGLFRIFEESLTNVGRYAKAKNVLVSLEKLDGEIVLTIKDDGIGFEIGKIVAKKTLGLLGIRERSLMMGGTCEINSVPGSGTRITVRIPYKKN